MYRYILKKNESYWRERQISAWRFLGFKLIQISFLFRRDVNGSSGRHGSNDDLFSIFQFLWKIKKNKDDYHLQLSQLSHFFSEKKTAVKNLPNKWNGKGKLLEKMWKIVSPERNKQNFGRNKFSTKKGRKVRRVLINKKKSLCVWTQLVCWNFGCLTPWAPEHYDGKMNNRLVLSILSINPDKKHSSLEHPKSWSRHWQTIVLSIMKSWVQT